MDTQICQTFPRAWTMEHIHRYVGDTLDIWVPPGLSRQQYQAVFTRNFDARRRPVSSTVTSGELQEPSPTIPLSQPEGSQTMAQLVDTVVRLQQTVSALASRMDEGGGSIPYSRPVPPTNTGQLAEMAAPSTSRSFSMFSASEDADGCPEAEESSSEFDAVPPAIRRQIWEGKDVNLVHLLVPDEIDSASRTVRVDNMDIQLRTAGDARLQSMLSIQQFVLAFNRYKDVFCIQWPGRRQGNY